jgi:hypothetical protein
MGTGSDVDMQLDQGKSSANASFKVAFHVILEHLFLG